MTEPGRDRHIEYAQARRDNETEAREELASRLPDLSPALRRRGDLTQAAKVMVAALRYFAPDTEVGNPVSRRDFGGSRSKEYAKLRRDNEAEAREALSGVIPERFHEDPDLERNDFNRTTKVVIAAAKYFDELSRRGGKDSVATGSEEVSEEVEGSCLEGSSSTLVDQTTTTTQTRLPQTPDRTAANISLASVHDSSPLTYSQNLSPSTSPEHIPKNQPKQPEQVSSIFTAIVPPPPSTIQALAPPEITILQTPHRQIRSKDREFDLKPPPPSTYHGFSALPSPNSTPSYTANIAVANATHQTKRSRPPSSNITPTSQLSSPPKSVAMPELQQLRQVTRRLVAKAEEAVLADKETDGDDDGGLWGVIGQAGDLIIDMIAVIEQKGADQRERKRIFDKWARMRGYWEAEGIEFQD